MENPPGFHDPLADPDHLHHDPLCNQLDALKAHIENALPVHSIPAINDFGPNGVLDANPVQGIDDSVDAIEPADNIALFEPPAEKYGAFESTPPLPQEGLSRNAPPNPPGLPVPQKRGGNIGRKGKNIIRSLSPSPRWHGAGSGILRSERFCPENHERINAGQCENCEKYRHWPEGTEEEPRECWYDCQPGYLANNSGEEEKDEEE